MPAWTPLLIQKIEIQALGFVLRKLQLNRHHRAEVDLHQHDHAQLILYLTGEGSQRVGETRRNARSGDLFVIPPRTPHGGTVQSPHPPLCLVLDYNLEGAGRVRAAYRHLSPDRLNDLSALLARVPAKGRLTLSDYSTILAVVARLLDPSPEPTASASRATLFDRVRTLLQAPVPLAKIARSAGYHPDHLTRKLKRETGMGLRALRDRGRLDAAQKALQAAPTVAEAASRCGFDDPNYFARWFKRQTGRSPSAWRA